MKIIPLVLMLASFTGPDDELPTSVAEGYLARNEFALELHRALHPEGAGANAFHSPHSVWTALAMLAEGARGESLDSLIAALAPKLAAADRAKLHGLAGDLGERLSKTGEGVSLSSANALWGQVGHPFRRSAVESLASHYGAALEQLEFTRDAEGARKHINRWVADHTGGHIEDLLPEGSLGKLTRLVLTNAVHFLADWSQPFDSSNTADRTFSLQDGVEATVAFMQAKSPRSFSAASFGADGVHRPYDETASGGFVAIELPYAGEQLAFLAIRPDDPAGLAILEAELDASRLRDIIEALEPTRLRFACPKFELRQTYDLAGAAGRLGLENLFSPKTANLTEFAEGDPGDLYVTGAFHQAFVRVDEKGTEAAAATGIALGERSMPRPAPELALDRPFLFLIRERTTGAILFLGRLADPR